MNVSQEVKDWHERSESLAAEIDDHLNSYPGPERSRINSSENVVIYLGNRYTLITGFIPPEVIAGNLKIGDGLKDKREQLQQDMQQGSRLTKHRFKP